MTPVDLRPVTSRDAIILFEAWGKYPENFTYLTARVFGSIGDAETYLSRLFQTPESLAFHVVDTSSGAVVGLVKAAVADHRAQIGYVIHRPHWGKGYASEAVRRIVVELDAMEAVSRIWATCAVDNVASARVLEKCGFEREALLRAWVRYPAQGDRAFDNHSYVRLPRG